MGALNLQNTHTYKIRKRKNTSLTEENEIQLGEAFNGYMPCKNHNAPIFMLRKYL